MIGKKFTFSRFPFALLVVTAALLLLYTGSSQITQATSFNPTQNVVMSDQTAGANPDITSFTSIPQTGDSAFFVQSFSFLPDSIAVAPDAAISEGTVAGDFQFDVRLGLGNSQCLVPFASPSSITFLHATTSRAVEVPFNDGHFDGSPSDPVPGNGVEAGADAYPRFLIQSVPGGEISRFFGHTIILGLRVHVHYLAYPAGALGLPAALGKPTLVTFNTGDVGGAPAPSVLTDSCSPFNSRVTQKGLAGDNPNTGADESDPASQPGGSSSLLTNPGPGTVFFSLLILSERDADNDGVDNGDDTCMYDDNVGSPYTPSDAGDSGEATVGGQTDRIDAACDNTSVFTDGNPNSWSASGPGSFCRAGAADDNFGSFSSFGVDCDRAAAAPPGDGYPNKGDNCPQVANGLGGDGQIDEDPPDGIDNDGDGQTDEDPVDGIDNRQVLPTSQLDSELLLPGAVYIDGGPKNDATGDLCDVNVDVPDGHFHQPLILNAKCITGGPVVDSDSDGYCDQTEAALGNADQTGTPEHIAIPIVCSDTVDNDLDGGTDLGKDANGDSVTDPATPADTGCQQPLHDVRMKVDEGTSVIYNPNDSCKSNNTDQGLGLFKLKIEEKEAGEGQVHPIEIGIYIDPVSSGGSFGSGTFTAPGTVTPGSTIPGVGVIEIKEGGTIVANGPVNFDNDTDTEWLAIARRNGSAGVEVRVRFPDPGPACASGQSNSTAFDYSVTFDLCHGNDPIPLGLAMGNNPKDCGAANDGGQDRLRNPGENCPGESDPVKQCGPADDAPQTISVNDRSR